MSALTMESILKDRRSQPHQLIEVFQDIQEHHGYISEQDMKIVSRELGVPEIEAYRVANFYKAFSLKPRGRHVFTICSGTACHVRGSKMLADQIKGQLGIGPGETTEDGMFTLEQVNCLGACALGPVVVLNGATEPVYYDHMTPGKLRKLIISLNGKPMEGADNANKNKARKRAKAAK